MITKIATFISITAFALIGAAAQAKVYDASEGRNGVSDQMLLQSIDQTHSLFGCDVGSFSRQVRSSADPVDLGNMPDVFAGNFDILNDNPVTDSCAVPIPDPDQFRNVAAR